MLATPLGMLMLVRPQFLNAVCPILVTPVPIVAVVREPQKPNASLSILVTLLGMVMLVKPA